MRDIQGNQRPDILCIFITGNLLATFFLNFATLRYDSQSKNNLCLERIFGARFAKSILFERETKHIYHTSITLIMITSLTLLRPRVKVHCDLNNNALPLYIYV